MNYRHAFHAGNFADLFKHAALIALIEALKGQGGLQVLDTHAGAGLYDLQGEMAQRSGESEAIARLMTATEAPAVFDALKAEVRAANPKGGLRRYPGSPVIAVRRLGQGDSYVGCEMRPDDHRLLAEALRTTGSSARAEALQADGYAQAARLPIAPGRRLVLIDPPFERADEYDQVVRAVAAILRRDSAAAIAVWLPLKDLDTFDRFVGRIEDLEPPGALIAELRLRPLHDPLKMNGCVLVVINPPAGIQAALKAAGEWIAANLGQAGAEARLWVVDG